MAPRVKNDRRTGTDFFQLHCDVDTALSLIVCVPRWSPVLDGAQSPAGSTTPPDEGTSTAHTYKSSVEIAVVHFGGGPGGPNGTGAPGAPKVAALWVLYDLHATL